MIRCYTYGNPIETDAVVEKVMKQKGEVPYFKTEKKEGIYTLTYHMEDKDGLYGLGENIRGINKRGYIYTSYCTDDPHHTESKTSLYGAHNFIVVKGKKTFGLFIDMPGKVTFDCGYEQKNTLVITIEGEDFDLYCIEGEDLLAITEAFRTLIGRSYIPPKWAFGYQQSRWGYKDEKDLMEVARGYRKNHIPLDAIYMDIDFMEEYKDFTIDKKAFVDFKKTVSTLKEEGIRLVPIVDAGVKIQKGYDVYDEGVAGNYFCKDEKGEDFVGSVWPGYVHFPDFLKKETRHWFGMKYKCLLDEGIEGFWNDMNEPAIFHSLDGVNEATQMMKDIIEKQGDELDCFAIAHTAQHATDIHKNYQRFYHDVDGKKMRHDKVHNLYGYNMTRAAGEAFDLLEPDKRILLFSRASYIGMHRYGGIWTGDNHSWWSHLLLNIKMMPSLNMCGLLYSGADIGGFGEHTTEDLLLRWIQFGCFTPLMRNHSAMGTREQEVYRFTSIEAFRQMIEIRYALVPYIYSEYMKAALNNKMYFRTLMMDYPEDKFVQGVEDQLMVGESMMIAPVYEQNAAGRYVYLPEEMLMIKWRSATDRDYVVMPKGHHYIEVELKEMICFIKPNHLVPLAKPALSIEALDENHLEICGFVVDEAHYRLYQDDGFTKSYNEPNNWTVIKVKKDEKNVEVTSSSKTLSLNLDIKIK